MPVIVMGVTDNPDPRPGSATDRFADCLEAVIAADPAAAPWNRGAGGAVGVGLLSALQGGPVGAEALRGLTPAAHLALYRRLYWVPCRAALLPPGPDRAMLALAVAGGPHQAVLIAQRAMGIAEDGVLDPATLPAFTPAESRALEAALDAARGAGG